jgi:hypothetical protein
MAIVLMHQASCVLGYTVNVFNSSKSTRAFWALAIVQKKNDRGGWFSPMKRHGKKYNRAGDSRSTKTESKNRRTPDLRALTTGNSLSATNNDNV